MERKLAESSSFTNPDVLEQYPHVLHRLIDMVIGECQPTLSQHEQLLTHLTECLYCQIALGVLVAAVRDHDRSSGSSDEPAAQLLSQVTDIIHETKARDDIRAYIEILEAKGEKKA